METDIRIKSIDDNILFEFKKENNTIKDTLNEAVIRKVNLSGANLNGADLSIVYLSGAKLYGANLHGANLSGANLNGADLSSANLYGADLSSANLNGANLSGAKLYGADLSGANLYGANLSRVDLSDADLRCADLSDSDLRFADLRGADLRDADLSDADLRVAKLNEHTIGLLLSCPEEGSFIGWKIAGNYIVKLQITENARRSSATTLKCRCSEALVLEIQNLDGTKANIISVPSNHDKSFMYTVGEIVKVDNFDDNRWKECSTGIHFFMNRTLAVQYA